jgi:hypothetical protein
MKLRWKGRDRFTPHYGHGDFGSPRQTRAIFCLTHCNEA